MKKSLYLAFLIPFLFPQNTQAQITPDNTLGDENSVVTPLDSQGSPVDLINGGATRGANLFHSFQEFNVDAGRGAYFNNPTEIENIFSRVTGGNVSNINGVLGVFGGNANLFFINPNGIIFGENARLDLGGSFFGSSADSFVFDNNFEFSASNPTAPPLLTINVPIGINFRDNPGDIVNNSLGNGLQVQPEETIALLGGNVTFDGGVIFAPSANVEIGGLTESGTINFSESGGSTFPDGVARGDVLFTNDSRLAIREEGGRISINARNFELNTDSEILAGIVTNTGSPNVQAADIIINATENVVIDSLNSDNTIINSSVSAEGIGNAGNIEITAKNISFINGGLIFSAIQSQGNTGNITLTATENIAFEGVRNLSQSGILSAINQEAIGNTGDINITAQNLSIKDGAAITGRVFGQGNSGNININVSDTILIDGEAPIEEGSFVTLASSINSEAAFGEGNSGNININTGNLSLVNGAEINADINGIGDAGDINITAEQISLDGFNTEISSDVFPDVQGNGGNINIISNSLFLTNGGLLSAIAGGEGNAGNITITSQDSVVIEEFGSIEADVFETGNAGNIDINTSLLSIDRSGVAISASIFADGNGGNIDIEADSIEIVRSFIDAQAFFGTGTAGNIVIETDKLILSDASQISVATRSDGNAGDLNIIATESIELSGATDTFRGGLIASAVDGSGNGGDINVFTGNLIIRDGATIVARNFPSFENSIFEPGTGQPGNINIQANSILLENGGRIDAATQSEIGEAANITLEVANDITLRDNSFISARALNNADGGNVTINANDGVVVAFPNQNNDIIASAEQGDGGNITITTQGIFGLEERKSTPPNTTNDIDASSEFGLQGDFSLNTPDVDPTTGLLELPASVGDISDTISQNPCEQSVGSEFIVTGKGGFPANPHDNLTVDGAEVDLVEAVSGEAGEQRSRGVGVQGLRPVEENNSQNTPHPSSVIPQEAPPARGWILNEQGLVVLTAYDPTKEGIQRTPQSFTGCDVGQ